MSLDFREHFVHHKMQLFTVSQTAGIPRKYRNALHGIDESVNSSRLRVFESLAACHAAEAQRLEGSKNLDHCRDSDIRNSQCFLRLHPTTIWAERTLKTLSLRDKIAQLVQIRVPGKFLNRRSEDFQAIQNDIKQNHVGGVVLFAGNIYESAVLLNELQDISRLPLLVAGDFERGAAFRIADTTSFPWTMALGASGSEQLAYRQGVVTARESRALGVHWIFAPVMDVNNNPDNPVINIRSFGEDPQLVARLGSAFIRGAKSGGVLTTAKAFPGTWRYGYGFSSGHGCRAIRSGQAAIRGTGAHSEAPSKPAWIPL